MKITPTKRKLIITTVLVLVVLGLHYFAYSYIKGMGAEVAALDQEGISLQAQVIEFSKYSPEELRTFAKAINNRVLPKGDFVNFIENVEKTARSFGVEVNVRAVDVEELAEGGSGDKETLRLKMETRGTWSETMKFVTYLEYLPYKVVIHDVGLSQMILTNDKGVSSTEWRGDIELTALKSK